MTRCGLFGLMLLALASGPVASSDTVDFRQGIDVSHYQGEVDWVAVKSAGMVFAITKATEGVNTVDSMFEVNWAAMKAAGLVRGAYHFFHTDKSAKQQANHFIATVKLQTGDLPPVLDVEITEGVAMEEIDDEIATWLTLVEKAYGVKPIIYANRNFVKTVLTENFASNPLWLAEYTSTEPDIPDIWSEWTLWQYSQSGEVSGVDGAVDLDRFQGSEEKWQALLMP